MDNNIENILKEYSDDGFNTDQGVKGSSTFSNDKDKVNSREAMLQILAGQKDFEFNLLENPNMVRALITQVRRMAKIKDDLDTRALNANIKALENIQRKSVEEYQKLDDLIRAKKTHTLKQTLLTFAKSGGTFDKIEPYLVKIENDVELNDKDQAKYWDLVGSIEDALFRETYTKENTASTKGESSGTQMAPTATNNIPIKFNAANGQTYYGIIRPPSGIITWEGTEARNAWLTDPDIKDCIVGLVQKGKAIEDAILKIRVDKAYFKVLEKEQINRHLFALENADGTKKIEYDDSDKTIQHVCDYILNKGERTVSHYDVSGGIMDDGDKMENGTRKKVNPYLDKFDRTNGVQAIISSINFWKMIKNIF
jgi:hypothetical protein